MKTLPGNTEDLSGCENRLTGGVALADFKVGSGLFLGSIGLEWRRHRNIVIEPSEDELNCL